MDNEVCTFDYVVEDREATASTVEVDYALRYCQLQHGQFTLSQIIQPGVLFSLYEKGKRRHNYKAY